MVLYYTDILRNDGLFDDTFPIKEVDSIVYEVDCKVVDVDTVDADVETSTPRQDLDRESVPSTGGLKEVDLILRYRLKPAHLSKGQYIDCVKGNAYPVLYEKTPEILNQLEDSNFDGVESLEKAGQAYAEKVIANFRNYQLYTGESIVLPEGMLALPGYREDGTPYMVFWKHGLEVKSFM